MITNLLKKYNELLELASSNEKDRIENLRKIFDRDIGMNSNFKLNNKIIEPTPNEKNDKIELLFRHLITEVVDRNTNKREIEVHRAVRLHWIKYLIDNNIIPNVLLFSYKEQKGIRTYLYDKDEEYVIVFEPLRQKESYYLLTAFKVRGKDDKRKKYEKKFKNRLNELY